MLLTGPMTALWTERTVVGVRLVGTNGRRVAAAETRPAWEHPYENQVVVTVAFSERDVARAGALAVTFWSDEQVANYVLAAPAGGLPIGFELDAPAHTLTWREAHWTAHP